MVSCAQPACGGEIGGWVIINIYFEMWGVVQVVSEMVTYCYITAKKIKLGAKTFLLYWGEDSTSIPKNF